VIDGQIRGAALELGHGISSCLHDLIDERVRLGDRVDGIVDERGLRDLPPIGEAVPIGHGQRPEIERVNALLTRDQLVFGEPTGALRLERSIVLLTETSS
jgi:hypothetical protein